MAQSGTGGEPEGMSYCAWFGFWGPLVVLAACVIAGAFFASSDAAPGDYACGLILAIAALLLAFMRVKSRFDGGPAGWGGFLFVDDVANLILVIIVFVILGMGGAFVASGYGYGGLYEGGVALFAVSALGVLLSIKRVFDNLDRQR